MEYIHATYVGESVFPNEYIPLKIENRDTFLLGNIIDEDFKLILQEDNSDITIRSHEPNFSWFINLDNEEISYDEYLSRYIALSKKTSRFSVFNE